MWGGWATAAVAMTLIGLAPDAFAVAALGAVAFGLLQYGSMIWQSMMQEIVPAEMLGRASSVDWMFSLCLSPIGILVAGVAAVAIGVRTTIVAGGLIGAAMALVVFRPVCGTRSADGSPAFRRLLGSRTGRTPPTASPADALAC